MYYRLILLISGLMQTALYAQTTLSLYPDAIPNAIVGPDREQSEDWNQGGLAVSRVSRPTLTVFLPPAEKATGLGIIICPGGGYGGIALYYEGSRIAAELTQMGVAAFVLKYRLPDSTTMIDRTIGPLQDAQQAIRLVRQRAILYQVSPHRIGLMGFSAGGHVAASAGTHFQKALIANPEKIPLRPDFLVLVYPVISFTDEIGHTGSRQNLLGSSPTPEQIRYFSLEYQVTPQTPPTFLLHAGDDTLVPVANSIRFYEALQSSGVAAELHIYPKGNHGFVNNWPSDNWLERCRTWFGSNGWLPKSAVGRH